MIKFLHVLILLNISTTILHAQSGGPPMITDDPGTPDKGTWEINFSFNTDLKTVEKEFEVPLIDINFGFNERTQLKLEFPYLFTISDPNRNQNRIGDITLGIKYRFLDEDKFGISLSLYPQITIATETDTENEYLLPLQIEKTFGKVVLGMDVRYAYLYGGTDFFQNGILIGYGLSESLNVMCEFVYWADLWNFDTLEGVLNLGLRYQANNTFSFIASLGTGLFSKDNDSKMILISFVGFQIYI